MRAKQGPAAASMWRQELRSLVSGVGRRRKARKRELSTSCRLRKTMKEQQSREDRIFIVLILCRWNKIVVSLQELHFEDIPNFDSALYRDSFDNYLNDLALNSNRHSETILKIFKLLQTKISETSICDSFLLIGEQVQLDVQIMKLAKERTKNNQQGQLRRNAIDLGRRLSLMAQAINSFFIKQKEIERRVARVQKDYPVRVEQKAKQLDQRIISLDKEIKESLKDIDIKYADKSVFLQERIDAARYQASQSVHDLERVLNSKVDDNWVKSRCKETQNKIFKELNIFEGKNAVDPQDFLRHVKDSEKRYEELKLLNVERAFQIRKANQFIQNRLIQKTFFQEQKVRAEKRLAQVYARFQDIGNVSYRNQIDMETCLKLCKKVETISQKLQKQVDRNTQIIDNLKLGDNFRKIIDSLDPDKIITLQTVVDQLRAKSNFLQEQGNMQGKQISKSAKELHELQVQFKNKNQNLDPQIIEPLLLKLLKSNFYMRMIQNHQVVIKNMERDNRRVEELEKRVVVAEHRLADNSLGMSMKTLQNFTKRELKESNKKIETLDLIIRQVWEQSKTKKHFLIQSTITDQSFIKFKQLLPEPAKLQSNKKEFAKEFVSQKTGSQVNYQTWKMQSQRSLSCFPKKR